MSYCCLSKQSFNYGSYVLRTIQKKEMPCIGKWRNAQLAILRQKKPLTPVDQERYWEDTLIPSFSHQTPAQILFSFLHEEQMIGYGGLTHIDWEAERAEVSFLLEPGRAQQKGLYEKDFCAFLRLLQDVAFEELKLHRLYAETFDLRPGHIFILEECGFTPEGRLKDHVKIEGRYVDSLIHGIINNE